jgi:hypothetical protein
MVTSDCQLLLRTATSAGVSRWEFNDYRKRAKANGVIVQWNQLLGRHCIATRAFSEGEVIIRERPLLESRDAIGNSWAVPVLQAFCAAPADVQAEVFNMHSDHGDLASLPDRSMLENISQQVASCAGAPWCKGVSEDTLKSVCYVFNLNAYISGSQENYKALFSLGSKLAHSCDANVAYRWVACKGLPDVDGRQAGFGEYFAKRAIQPGEMLTTNYLGDMSRWMSTPSRREALMNTKLFLCHCQRCASLEEDPHRRLPCAKCHPRGADGLLPRPIAFPRHEGRKLSDGTVFRVSYVAPRRATVAPEAPHSWGPCAECGKTFADGDVLPGGSGTNELSGRDSERQVEQYVQGLLLQICTKRGNGGEQLHLCPGDPLLQKIQKLETIVARRVGAKHWASVRLRALLQLVGIASSD